MANDLAGMANDDADDLITALTELAKEFELADVYVFGSRAAEFGAGAATAGDIAGPHVRPGGARSDLDIGGRSEAGG